MAEQVYRIEIPINVSDNTEPALGQAQAKVSKFELSIDRTKKQINSMNKTRLRLVASAIDKASAVLDSVGRKAWGLAGKTFRFTVRVLDLATKPLQAVFRLATSVVGLLTAGAGVWGGFVKPLDMSGDFEQTQIAFETMLKSAEKATKFLAEAEDFANRTPFEFPELADSAKLMQAFGFNIEKVLPMLETIGDTSSGLGAGSEGIERIVRALGQMQAKGRVMTQEMLQLQELGVPAAEILMQKLGLTQEQVADIGQEGIEAGRAIQALLEGMEERFGGMMQKQSRTLKGLLSTIKDTFSNKIIRRWGDGLREGITPLLTKLVDWIDINQDKITKWGEAIKSAGRNISDWIISKVEKWRESIFGLVNSAEWKAAKTFGEKAKLAWDMVIVEPFQEWWNGKGKTWLMGKAAQVGQGLGNALKSGILGLLGLSLKSSAMDDGLNIGMTFAEGFIKGFEGKKVGKAILNALKGIFKDAATLLPGGESPSKTAWLSTLLIGGVFAKLGGFKVLGGATKLFSGIGGAAGTAATTGAGTAAASAGTAAATAAGSITAAGLATTAGWAAGALGAFSAINDLAYAVNTRNEKERRTAYASGGSKAAMVALGAAIGTAILPGLGTAIGAGIGGLGALFFGGKLGKTISGWIDGSGKIEKTARDLRSAANEYQNMADKAYSTKRLSDEYNRLNQFIIEGKGTTEEMAEAQNKLQAVIESLAGIYPGLITQYDIENGKLKEKLNLLKDITEADRQSAKLKLEQEVATGEMNFAKIEDRFRAAKDRMNKLQEEKDALEKAISQFKTYELEMMKLFQDRHKEGYDWEKDSERVQTLLDKINEVARTLGYDFSGSGLAGFSFAMQDKTFEEERLKVIDALLKEDEQLAQLRDQYSSLYEAQKKLIEFDLGGTLEEQAQKYYLLSEAEQQRFLEAIGKVSELERKMKELPTEKKINIDVLARYMSESNPDKSIQSGYYPDTNSISPHATGGILHRPHIGLVAEAGPEAIIPLSSSRRSRGIDLWNQVGGIFGFNLSRMAFSNADYAADEIGPYANVGILGNLKDALRTFPDTNEEPTKVDYVNAPVPYKVPFAGKQGITLKVQVQSSPTYDIKAAANADEIIAVIRENQDELADELSSEIASKLSGVFQNMPD
ncbi:MAG: tape measure protein [Firmicutes bacterium]|nr:tape measure protein [Bacillota bacterium]